MVVLAVEQQQPARARLDEPVGRLVDERELATFEVLSGAREVHHGADVVRFDVGLVDVRRPVPMHPELAARRIEFDRAASRRAQPREERACDAELAAEAVPARGARCAVRYVVRERGRPVPQELGRGERRARSGSDASVAASPVGSAPNIAASARDAARGAG